MRIPILITVGAVIALLALFGCPKGQPPSQEQTPPKSLIADLPLEMTVRQRTTTPAPGSTGSVQVTVDDITRGQTMVSLALETGEPLLAPTSLREGASASFEFEGQTYYVTLKHLNNELIGEDSAVLVIDVEPPATGAGRPTPSRDSEESEPGVRPANLETDRIRKLIDHVRSLEDAAFVRNGEEHTPAEAADHLQRKWEYAGDDIATAEQFIQELATKSSASGELYKIRFANGKELPSGEYLRQQLEEME